jgi:hypothetical protein
MTLSLGYLFPTFRRIIMPSSTTSNCLALQDGGKPSTETSATIHATKERHTPENAKSKLIQINMYSAHRMFPTYMPPPPGPQFPETHHQRVANRYLGTKPEGQCVRCKDELTGAIVPHSTDHHQLV